MPEKSSTSTYFDYFNRLFQTWESSLQHTNPKPTKPGFSNKSIDKTLKKKSELNNYMSEIMAQSIVMSSMKFNNDIDKLNQSIINIQEKLDILLQKFNDFETGFKNKNIVKKR